MATIIDVAKCAGVSRSTVSRVLTNSTGVNLVTKQKVLQAIKELGYQPSRAAQTLRNRKTYMIAALVPRISNAFNAELMQGIEREAAKHNYQVTLCNSENNPDKELEYLRMLKKGYVDGVILTAFRGSFDDLRYYQKFGPIVFVSEYGMEQGFSTVRINNVQSAYRATKHLIDLGHKKIGMVTGLYYSHMSHKRAEGYKQALEDHNISYGENWITFSSYGIEQGKDYLKKLMIHTVRPSAIFATNDELAVGIIQQAKEMNIHIPNELAVVGFDDQQIATVVDPKLTTIKQPVKKMGSKAITLLIDSLTEAATTYTNTILDTRLIIRDSCGAKNR